MVNLLDRVVGWISPKAGVARLHHRQAFATFARHYEGAAAGRRTGGWTAPSTSANAAFHGGLGRLRDRARDLRRNDSWIKNAHRVVTCETVGTGIVGEIRGDASVSADRLAKVDALWKAWAGSKQCDAAGREDFYGIQRQVMDAVSESGSALVRHRPRRLSDGLAVPLQLQVIEPDYLDTTKDTATQTGTRVIQGIEFDALGQRQAYWLFKEHPGETYSFNTFTSSAVPADRVAHVFWSERNGQVDGVPWSASALIGAKDFQDFEDAHLLRQKIAACFVAFVHDSDPPEDLAMGGGEGSSFPGEDLEPGMYKHLGPGKDITFGVPPTVTGFGDYSTGQLRKMAKAFGITYESLTGDYSRTNFSSSRAAWNDQKKNVEQWRWHMLVPQLCDQVFAWFVQAAELAGQDMRGITCTWTPSRYALVNPKEDVAATKDAIRSGLTTLSEALREQGINPDDHFAEYAEDLKRIDALGIVLDSDPRPHPYSVGLLQQPATKTGKADAGKAGQ